MGLLGQALVRRKPTKPCHRCGLRYPVDEEECVHCKHIKTDRELSLFKEKLAKQREAKKNLGLRFLVIAVILTIILLLSFW